MDSMKVQSQGPSAACKFWNTAKLSHSDLLMRVIKADVELGRSCQASWSAQFQLAARELMGEVRTSLTRFRLGNSGLGVEKARFEGCVTESPEPLEGEGGLAA
ncbi:hypothetical protein HaLaN_25289 [Haematococcus lacustris]|uniref:Uncharacterized protein n=1 Tax=Haematococcus lacustris TaxID=44745 RepID=A0A699ZWG6_HAELA|nr:hypothetical protein HaLaN_25289 [Haematococcus lacustris]